MASEELLQDFEKFEQSGEFFDWTEERKKRDKAIYDDCQRLQDEGKKKTAIIRYLMKTYKIATANTIYVILHREEERQKETEEQQPKTQEQ